MYDECMEFISNTCTSMLLKKAHKKNTISFRYAPWFPFDAHAVKCVLLNNASMNKVGDLGHFIVVFLPIKKVYGF